MNRRKNQTGQAGQSVSGPTHIKDLVPDPANRRAHNPRNIGMVVDALQAVGAARSIVIDEDNVVLAGNGVLEAAGEAGITRLRVVEADGQEIIAVRRSGLSAAQKRDLAIADNRTAELATWNAAQFRDDLGNGLDFGKFFSKDELAEILGTEPSVGLTDPDEVPAERPTGIMAGDLFELGQHRLLCGDCTVAGDVARVVGNSRADLCFTSPPYVDLRSYGGADLTVEHLAAFIPASVAHVGLFAVNLGIVRRDGAVQRYWDAYCAAAESAGLKLLSWNVWHQGVQGSVGKLTAMFPIEHEFIFIFGADRVALAKTIPNKEPGPNTHVSDRQSDGTTKKKPTIEVGTHRPLGTVISLPGEQSRGEIEKDHPARFPVALATTYIQATAAASVFDPFAGSGSTLMAAEQLDRSSGALEIEPRYCQVIIDRWEAFTGQKAQKVGELVRA